MMYHRTLAGRVKDLAKRFPALVLTGARQTGKTTLLKSLFPSYNYITLDVPTVAEMAETDCQSFLATHKPPLIVDEVQYAPKLFRHLKVVIDEDPEKRGLFILTGSQKFTLMKEVSESLAGRVGLLELDALSSEELGGDLVNAIRDRGPGAVLARGFYPRLWAEPDFPVVDYYRSYIATYLERDVRQILNVSSLRDFERFMRAIALRSGNVLNKSELAKDVGIHHKTANDWLSVLEASNQITLLEPYFGNETKRLVKSPKIFFNDTGILCFLLGLTEDSVTSYANIGAIWESFILSRLKKIISSSAGNQRLWFYRNQQGLEVDFVLETAGKLHLFEVKWTQEPDRKAFGALQQLAGKIAVVESQGLVCRAPHDYQNQQDQWILNGFTSGYFSTLI